MALLNYYELNSVFSYFIYNSRMYINGYIASIHCKLYIASNYLFETNLNRVKYLRSLMHYQVLPGKGSDRLLNPLPVRVQCPAKITSYYFFFRYVFVCDILLIKKRSETNNKLLLSFKIFLKILQYFVNKQKRKL